MRAIKRRHIFPYLGCVVCAALTPPQALAGTASVDFVDSSDYTRVQYVAAPGEENVVTVSSSSPMFGEVVVRFVDSGAPVTALPPCISVDVHTAECRAQGYPAPTVELGDLNDRFGIPEPSPRLGGAGIRADELDLEYPSPGVYGGPGDDTLYGGGLNGGSGDDKLYGSQASREELDGGGGRDELYGGGGDQDVLIDGDTDGAPGDAGPGPDILDGGDGAYDRVLYSKRRAPVRVNLHRRETGEGDRVSGIEDVIGGRGDDHLTGDDGRNLLLGGPGDDRLRGRGGADYLEGADGFDSYRCGEGGDFVSVAQPTELVPRDCDGVLGSSEGLDFALPYPELSNRSYLSFVIACIGSTVDEEEDDPEFEAAPHVCRGRVRLRESSRQRRLLGVGSFERRGAARPFRARTWLTALGERLARRKQGVRTTVSITGNDKRLLGDHYYLVRLREGWTIRLKLKR